MVTVTVRVDREVAWRQRRVAAVYESQELLVACAGRRNMSVSLVNCEHVFSVIVLLNNYAFAERDSSKSTSESLYIFC